MMDHDTISGIYILTTARQRKAPLPPYSHLSASSPFSFSFPCIIVSVALSLVRSAICILYIPIQPHTLSCLLLRCSWLSDCFIQIGQRLHHHRHPHYDNVVGLLMWWAQRIGMQIMTIAVKQQQQQQPALYPSAEWVVCMYSKLCGRPITWPDDIKGSATPTSNQRREMLAANEALFKLGRGGGGWGTPSSAFWHWALCFRVRSWIWWRGLKGRWAGLNVYYDYGYVMRRIFQDSVQCHHHHLLLLMLTITSSPTRRKYFFLPLFWMVVGGKLRCYLTRVFVLCPG